MKSIFWLLYIGIGYMAYGWKGLFWGILLGHIVVYIFWTIIKEMEDDIVKRIKEKLNK